MIKCFYFYIQAIQDQKNEINENLELVSLFSQEIKKNISTIKTYVKSDNDDTPDYESNIFLYNSYIK